jgi:hypothetical protein
MNQCGVILAGIFHIGIMRFPAVALRIKQSTHSKEKTKQ